MRKLLIPVATAAFVMAGDFKSTAAFAFLPIDLTLVLAVVVLATIAYRLVRGHFRPELIAVAVGFAFLLPSVFISAATSEYGSDKILRFFMLTFLATLAPVAQIQDMRDIERQVWALTGVSAIVVTSSILNPQKSATWANAPITAEGVDTIALGSAAGVVVVTMVLGLAWQRVRWFIALPLGASALYSLLQSGSRGPLFATALAIAVGGVLTRRRPKLSKVVGLSALCLAGAICSFAAAPLASQQRIMDVLLGRIMGTDVEIRQHLYDIAIDSIMQHPFGIGWGNYQNIAFSNYRYPHNLFVEVLAETGVVFGGLFLLWILVHVWRTRLATINYAGGVSLALLAFMFGEASVSGDLNDDRVKFYALGIAIAARAVITRTGTCASPGTAQPTSVCSTPRPIEPSASAHTNGP